MPAMQNKCSDALLQAVIAVVKGHSSHARPPSARGSADGHWSGRRAESVSTSGDSETDGDAGAAAGKSNAREAGRAPETEPPRDCAAQERDSGAQCGAALRQAEGHARSRGVAAGDAHTREAATGSGGAGAACSEPGTAGSEQACGAAPGALADQGMLSGLPRGTQDGVPRDGRDGLLGSGAGGSCRPGPESTASCTADRLARVELAGGPGEP